MPRLAPPVDERVGVCGGQQAALHDLVRRLRARARGKVQVEERPGRPAESARRGRIMVEGGYGITRPPGQLSEQELVPRDAPVASGRTDGGGEPVPVGQRLSDVVGGDVLEQVAAERAEARAGSGPTLLEERPRLGLAVGPAEALGLALVVVVEQRPPACVDADQAEPAILPLHEHRPARRQERRHLVQRDGPDGDLDPEEAAVGLHREEARDRWEDDLVPVE